MKKAGLLSILFVVVLLDAAVMRRRSSRGKFRASVSYGPDHLPIPMCRVDLFPKMPFH